MTNSHLKRQMAPEGARELSLPLPLSALRPVVSLELSQFLKNLLQLSFHLLLYP